MTDVDLEDSLVKWVNTFSGLSKPCENLADLSDGIILSDILYQISPGTFPLTEYGAQALTYQQRLSVLSDLAGHLKQFYKEHLGLTIDTDSINLSAVADGDFKEILKVAELGLGVSVQCEDKDTYIRNIMSLDTEAQAQIMILIEGLLNGSSAVLAPPTPGKRRISQGSAGYHDDDHRTDVMDAELQRLTAENQRLMQEVESLRTEHASSVDEHKVTLAKMNEERTQWNKLLAQQKEEIDRIKKTSVFAESQTHEVRAQLHDNERTISDLRAKVADLSKAAQENRSLRDELDVVKAKLVQSAKDEAALDKYKKLAATAADLKKQLKDSEEQMNSYIEKNMEYEEQLKKIPNLKSQIENYRQQLVTLEGKSSEVQVTLQKKEFELNKVKETVATLTSEKDRQRQELEAARLKVSQLSSRANGHANDDEDGDFDANGLAELLTPEIKAKIARLEHENKMLRSTSQDSERMEMMEAQLADATRLKTKFEQDYLSANQKLLQFESDVQALQNRNTTLEVESAAASRKADSSFVSSRVESTHLLEQIDTLQKEGDQLRQDLVKAHTAAKVIGKEAMDALRAENEKLTANIEKQSEEMEKLSEETDKLKDLDRRRLEELTNLLKEKDTLSRQYMTIREQISVQDRTVIEQQVALQHKTNEVRRIAEENQSLTSIAKHANEQLNGLQHKVAELENKVFQLEKERSNLSIKVKEAEDKLTRSGAEIANLLADKSRLESYMKQAKQVIVKQQEDWKTKQKEMRQRDMEKFETNLEAVTAQLRERDLQIEQLKKSREEEKLLMKKENRLVVTAFYEMGLDLLRMRALPRLANPVVTSPLGRLRQQYT
mmetsp:Transcript_45648/g.74433  ORF Transcript_45648/g.74433 Transcript_45648/m.74433 type:complete len:837 (-) Transcript_45648:309-2819(-)|eukprot:CAMPEP_0184658326 /NCGR_PEP_ID=MMETSP0308-20130426/24967_1 /TAXON_ID=38269 /ORGANISM="Gloeochaete witrockiana, Strain SAG 46.84" /LENGTH=836 /DNA_ID=CAMNT_0027097239 /DNA_START=48 /DNA_END=2558 /DNA_ORIENTATION=-